MPQPHQLNIDEVMQPTLSPKELQTLYRLLADATSLPVVGQFLKNKDLPFSAGSWKEMIENRLSRFLNEDKITHKELYDLLSVSEEYGRTHSFLYRCDPSNAAKLLSKAHVERHANNLGLKRVFTNPLVLDLPDFPKIAQIRWDKEKRGNCLVFKIIEKRETKEYIGERHEDSRFIKEWRIIRSRAVNTVRLFDSGLLEFRLQSHRNSSSSRYSDILNHIWHGMLIGFLPPKQFAALSMQNAKSEIWRKKDELAEIVRFSDSVLRNGKGNTMIASSKDSISDLSEDEFLTKGVDAFMEGGASCDSSNIWWKKGEDSLPSKDIHMLLSGKLNEFAVTMDCNKDDFEYVFDRIASFA